MKKKTKIIVTGKNGQLAKTLIMDLQKKYNFLSYDKKDIDITKKKDLLKLKLKGVSILINTAAYNDVEKSEKKNFLANQTNFYALKNLKDICDKHNIFLIHFSTDYVFDGKKKSYFENDLVNPINEYGKSKAKGESFLLNSKSNNYLILRLSWVYSNIGINFFTKLSKLLESDKKISIVNDQFGIPTSAKFISYNLGKIIKKIINKKKISTIYHLTPNGKTSWYNFSVMISEFLFTKNQKKNKNVKIYPIKSNFNHKANRPLNSVLNSMKIQKMLNVKFKNWDYYFYKEFK